MGPIIIVDKSVLESLTTEEALLLEKLFFTNITPILSLEVLANLKETPRSARLSAEQAVALLSEKIPVTNSAINAHHNSLVVAELTRGAFERHPIPMTCRPILANTPKTVKLINGETGSFYEPSWEERALANWREGKFTEFDALMAEFWKHTQKSISPTEIAEGLKSDLRYIPKLKSIEAVKEYADLSLKNMNRKQAQKLLITLYNYFGFSNAETEKYRRQWRIMCRNEGRIIPPVEFAPYAHHVFKVDLFYNIALTQNLVAMGKKSKSHIDLQYLYYLPFCSCFMSKDKFHRQVSPLFMDKNQTFVWGEDIKADLIKIRECLIGMSSEKKEKYNDGYPPPIEGALICQLFDQYAPSWKRRVFDKVTPNPEANKRIVDMLNAKLKAIESGNYEDTILDGQEGDFLIRRHYLTREQMKKRYSLSDKEVDEIIQTQDVENKT